MKIPEMRQTEITVVDGCVVISQMKEFTYSTMSISIPVPMWDFVCRMVEEEMAKPVKPVEEE